MSESEVWKRTVEGKDYLVSTARDRLDLELIHDFLARQSCWAKGIPREIVEASIRNSLCFGLFHSGRQIGFARVISDYATIAYLGDVFVLPGFRGLGLSKWLMECIVSHPQLQGLGRWILLTGDAHGLYEKLGFTRLAHPESYMERHNPHVYRTDG
ncbi:MAG TPA: GNAT family N-acetyltransferase [Terracidiphilus sp.]|nr:GNAT family N-acetyltransferase [Terracidiphilus sp.]